MESNAKIDLTGLFKHAIGQSGNSLAPWAIQSNPRKTFTEFAKELNCSRPTTQEMKECLKKVDVEDITEACAKTVQHPHILNRFEIQRNSKPD